VYTSMIAIHRIASAKVAMNRFREKIKDLLSYSMGNIVWYNVIRFKRRKKVRFHSNEPRWRTFLIYPKEISSTTPSNRNWSQAQESWRVPVLTYLVRFSLCHGTRSVNVVPAFQFTRTVTLDYSCEFGSMKYYALCGFGGILSCGLTHTALVPLDLVKCRIQVRSTVKTDLCVSVVLENGSLFYRTEQNGTLGTRNSYVSPHCSV